MMQWKLAIFDWNGTLINDLPLAYAGVVHIFHTLMPEITPPSLDEYKNKITSNFTEFYYEHGIPRNIRGDELNNIRVPFYNANCSSAQLHAGAAELLAVCKKQDLKIAMVSASPEYVEKDLSRFGIFHMFDKIRLKAWSKNEALVETLDFFGVKSCETFYVDDTYDGLIAAKDLGILPLGFTAGYNSQERILAAQPNKNFVANSLYEVAEIIKKGDRQ